MTLIVYVLLFSLGQIVRGAAVFLWRLLPGMKK